MTGSRDVIAVPTSSAAAATYIVFLTLMASLPIHVCLPVFDESAAFPAYSTHNSTLITDLDDSERQRCCSRLNVKPPCLAICAPKADVISFMGELLCRFEYTHIAEHCVEGRPLDVSRPDLIAAMHMAISLKDPSSSSTSDSKELRGNITSKYQSRHQPVMEKNSASWNTRIPWRQRSAVVVTTNIAQFLVRWWFTAVLK